MSLSSVNNVKDSMARLNVLFSDMNAELQRVKNYYDGMIQEAQHSFVDSQQHWINKARQEQSRLSSMSGERLAQVDEMVNCVWWIKAMRNAVKMNMLYAQTFPVLIMMRIIILKK